MKDLKKKMNGEGEKEEHIRRNKEEWLDKLRYLLTKSRANKERKERFKNNKLYSP